MRLSLRFADRLATCVNWQNALRDWQDKHGFVWVGRSVELNCFLAGLRNHRGSTPLRKRRNMEVQAACFNQVVVGPAQCYRLGF